MPTSTGHPTSVEAQNRWGLTWEWAEAALAIAVIVAVIFSLQFSTPIICCNDYDGYYHIRWSRMLWDGLRTGEFPVAFTWLPLTTLNAGNYADQQLLYHLLLIPFTWGKDLRWATKMATAIFSSLGVLALFWLLLRRRVRYPLLWLLAMFGASSHFLHRLSFTRANGLSLLLLAVSIWLLFERKYRGLAIVAFLYVWAYNLFILLWIASFCWIAVTFWGERRFEWRPLPWLALGTALGFLLNPYFPQNLSLFWLHIRMQNSPSGAEWFPMSKRGLVMLNPGALIAMIAGCAGCLYLWRTKTKHRLRMQFALFFLLFSFFLFFITVHSRRFTEYWVPFAVVFAAYGFGPWLEGGSTATAAPKRFKNIPRVLGVSAIVVVLLVYTLAIRRPDLSPPTRATSEEFADAAVWLRDHVAPGERIFNISWASFPKLYYYDSLHSYVVGLDANYLSYQNPELGTLYSRISDGLETDPAPLIRQRFNCEYVFVEIFDDRTIRFLKNAARSGKFTVLFRTERCLVLRIIA